MDNKKNIIVAGLVAVVVLVGGFNAVKAGLSFLDKVAISAGTTYGNRLPLPPVEDESVPSFALDQFEQSGPTVSSAGDTFTLQPMAQKLVVTSTESNTNTASTTFGTTLNPTAANGGRTRVITKLTFRALGTADTWLGGPLIMDFNTSTNQYASSTAPIYSTTLTTSTDPGGVEISTSTFTQKWKALWRPGEYLGCQTNRIVSTTNGYCVAEYFTLD